MVQLELIGCEIMNKILKFDKLKLFFYFLASVFTANCYLLLKGGQFSFIMVAIVTFLYSNIMPLIGSTVHTKRLKLCDHGRICLTTFAYSCLVSVIYHIVFMIWMIPNVASWTDFLYSVLVCVVTLSILFWNGIINVYLFSVQLGIKHRVIGILCGLIPIANLFALGKIVKVVKDEVVTEENKYLLNESRKDKEICSTKYPVLFVHGVFFRDFKNFNYWGRIPKELEKNGCKVYYGNHQSALSVKDSAKELAERIRNIVAETNCKKVNIIAHSKGGLDVRYAIAKENIGEMVASLTTINTPHKGCEFADYLLTKVPKSIQNKIATTYNTSLRQLGDKNPDFMASVNDLTASGVKAINDDIGEEHLDNIYCQSYGSILNKATSGKFPLNLSYHLVKYFDGKNDGLVSIKSFPWGENYTLLTVKGNRGISHGDMIDLNRENIKGFDVREFYVQLVSDLKNRNL